MSGKWGKCQGEGVKSSAHLCRLSRMRLCLSSNWNLKPSRYVPLHGWCALIGLTPDPIITYTHLQTYLTV